MLEDAKNTNSESVSLDEPYEQGEAGSAPETEASTPPSISILTDAVDEFKCSACGCRIDVTDLEPFTQVECPDCSAVEGVPARLGNFLLLKLLGTGGMGVVYYAKDESLGRFVAIKVMLQSLGDDAEFLETFRREAQAVARLNHPNIAQIYSFGQEKGQPYIVMELVSGDRVDAMMEEEGGIAPKLAVRICFEVALGLNAADEAGIVHGDIKPENILLDKKGRAKVVDFGLAQVSHGAQAEGIWGTPYYIAPEKIRRQKVDARADIYSLGATLYHVLAGKPPFEGETPVAVVKARLEMPPPDLKEARPDIPDEVVSVVTRMLATERTERYPTYKSLISDLQKAMNSLGGDRSNTARLGGKHIRLKKKKSTLNVPTGASSDHSLELGENQSRKKKIIISRSVGRALKGGPTVAPPPTPEEIAQKKRKQAKARAKALTTISILLILLIGGGITGLVVHQKQKTREQRTEYFALLNAQQAAETVHDIILNTASNAASITAKTGEYESVLKAAILTITGQELDVPIPEPEPEPEPPENTDALGEGEEQPNTKATEAGAEAVAADAEETDAAGEEAPETETAAEAGEATEDGADTGKIEVVQDEPDVELPPIAISALNTLLNQHKLQSMNRRIQALVEPTETAYAAVLQSSLSTTAIASLAELQTIAEKAELYKGSVDALYEAANKTYTDICAEKQVFINTVEADRLAAIEDAKRQEVADEKARQRLALEARGQAETEQAQLDHADMKLLFTEHNFVGVLAGLEKRRQGYQTEVGKGAIQLVIDRAKHVKAMQDEIIKNINKSPFAWGWGSGSSSRDVVRAGEEGIYIRDSKTATPWSAVGVAQMLKFVDHYIEVRDTRATSKAQLAFGAALYCNEFGEKGQAKSNAYLNSALDLGFPRDEQERLLLGGW